MLVSIFQITLHVYSFFLTVFNDITEVERQKELTRAVTQSETYMSSREWLAMYGLTAKRLTLYDALSGVAFKHTDGVVDLRHAPDHTGDQMQTDAVSLKSQSKLCSSLLWFPNVFSIFLKGRFYSICWDYVHCVSRHVQCLRTK